ncbi:hypothetical protein H8S21_17470 [Erwinia persicina]|uniref:hypothetical protein n=1 Tax=Erwinia persicina TaxID=55211 RepID=UPI001654A991|nr:hypothetical protein [Erwinia persicina]MBC3947110.1 hypothetical protein [Erwinia persicina]
MDDVIASRMSKLSVDERHAISTVFPNAEIVRLLQAEPEVLVEKIDSVFLFHPGIAERYCYSYILKDVVLHNEPHNLKLETEEDIDLFDNVVARTLDELKGVPGSDSLVLTRYYIDFLTGSAARNKKKKALCRLINSKRNHAIMTDKIKKLFPAWINSLEDLFDYKVVAEKYGYYITEFLELDICPYCGIENIQTYKAGDIDVRPDLDHFYPKTRFPFLAMSIYNLIPSGHICNQKHKKNHSMLGHLHPFSDGIDEGALFVFGYIPDSKIEHTLNVSLTRQTSDAKENNLKIFKINPLYNNNNELKRWFAKTQNIMNIYKENGGSIKEYVGFEFIVNLGIPETCEFAQKYKVDALNDMFGEDFTITQQKHK